MIPTFRRGITELPQEAGASRAFADPCRWPLVAAVAGYQTLPHPPLARSHWVALPVLAAAGDGAEADSPG